MKGRIIKCPRCNRESKATEKRWVYGNFDVILYYCEKCNRSFNAYFQNENFVFTIPKPGSLKPPIDPYRKIHIQQILIKEEEQSIKNIVNVSDATLKDVLSTYNEYKIKKNFTGYQLKIIYYSSLYLILRKERYPISLSEFAIKFDLPKITIGKIYRTMIRMNNHNIPRLNPLDLLRAKISEINLSEDILIKEMPLLSSILENKTLIGSSPLTLAAALTYYLISKYELNVSKVKICEIYGVSGLSLRNMLKRINLPII